MLKFKKFFYKDKLLSIDFQKYLLYFIFYYIIRKYKTSIYFLKIYLILS